MTESFILPFFLTIRILDIIDILLVAFLMYQLYNLMKGTVAINIFIAIFVLYLFWLVVKALNMQIMSTLLGQVMGVGVIALIIVFQQEIRRFLLMIGTRYMTRRFSLENLFSWNIEAAHKVQIKAIVNACMTLAGTYTGALIAVARNSSLQAYAETGEIINANTTERLIESIFSRTIPA
jgi:DNA integrity scanning protein DisA with diadenylate cyclase activity